MSVPENVYAHLRFIFQVTPKNIDDNATFNHIYSQLKIDTERAEKDKERVKKDGRPFGCMPTKRIHKAKGLRATLDFCSKAENKQLIIESFREYVEYISDF